MKPRLRILALAVFTVPLMAQASSDIRFTARIPPGAHKLSERLPIEIQIENVSDKPLYIYGNLNYYIMLFASTSEGKPIKPNMVIQTLGPPPEKESFTMLLPRHSLGIVWKEDLKGLGIQAPGSYRLELDYRSFFEGQFAFGLPVWTGEKSTSVTITVSQ